MSEEKKISRLKAVQMDLDLLCVRVLHYTYPKPPKSLIEEYTLNHNY